MKHILLVIGKDDYLVEEAAKRFRLEILGPDAAPTATEIVSGLATNESSQLESISRCRESWETPAFFDPVKLTWWRNVVFLPSSGAKGSGDAPRKLAESVKASLEKFAKSLASCEAPENQYLLITAPALMQTSIFAKALAKVADVRVFAAGATTAQERDAALSRLDSLAKAAGVSFASPEVQIAFIDKVGFDTRTIASELDKMRTYLGAENRSVGMDDVLDVSAGTASEIEIYELSEAVARQDPGRVAEIWRGYENDSSNGIMASVFMEKTFREWIVLADALEHGLISPEGYWSKNIPRKSLDDLNAAGVGPNVAKAQGRKVRQVLMFKRKKPGAYIQTLRRGRFMMFRLRERMTLQNVESHQVEIELLRIAKLL